MPIDPSHVLLHPAYSAPPSLLSSKKITHPHLGAWCLMKCCISSRVITGKRILPFCYSMFQIHCNCQLEAEANFWHISSVSCISSKVCPHKLLSSQSSVPQAALLGADRLCGCSRTAAAGWLGKVTNSQPLPVSSLWLTAWEAASSPRLEDLHAKSKYFDSVGSCGQAQCSSTTSWVCTRDSFKSSRHGGGERQELWQALPPKLKPSFMCVTSEELFILKSFERKSALLVFPCKLPY